MNALPQPERDRWLAIFHATDAAVARCVSSGVIPKGSALAILTEFSRQVDRYDARLANDMAPRISAGAGAAESSCRDASLQDFHLEVAGVRVRATLEWRGQEGAFWGVHVGNRGPFRPAVEVDLEQARAVAQCVAEFDRRVAAAGVPALSTEQMVAAYDLALESPADAEESEVPR